MALPMHRRTTDSHRAADDAFATLIVDEIARPLILSVRHRAAAVIHPVFRVEQTLAGIQNDDRYSWFQFGQFLSQEDRRDSAPDNTDIALKARHDFLLRAMAA